MKFVLSKLRTPCAWAAGKELTLEEAGRLLSQELAERSRYVSGPLDRDFKIEVIREESRASPADRGHPSAKEAPKP